MATLIDPEKCIGCDECHAYCPVGAIRSEGEVSVIDQEQCVECGCCFKRSRACAIAASSTPTGRGSFSDG